MCFPLISNHYLVTLKTNLQALTVLGKGEGAQLSTAAFTRQVVTQSPHFLSYTALVGTKFIKPHCGTISPLNDKFHTKLRLGKFNM